MHGLTDEFDDRELLHFLDTGEGIGLDGLVSSVHLDHASGFHPPGGQVQDGRLVQAVIEFVLVCLEISQRIRDSNLLRLRHSPVMSQCAALLEHGCATTRRDEVQSVSDPVLVGWQPDT